MSLPAKKGIFGVKSIALYNKTTGLPYGLAEVVGSVSLSFSAENVPLTGGAQIFPWQVATGAGTSELSMTLREYPNWIFDVFYGNAVTEKAADADGAVSTIANKYGTSVVATTGIASATVKSGSEADVKFTKYIVKAVSATTVDVYAMGDVDFKTGTDKTFEDGTLKITASPLTITTSTAVTIPGFGLELTGDSGTIAMTIGDTATFETISINTGGSTEVTIGSSTTTYPTFGAVIYAQKEDGRIVELDVYNMKAVGLPFNFTEKAWAEAEITGAAFYSAENDAVFRYRDLQE